MVGPPKKRQRREEDQEDSLPKKKYYRQRAHANPFSDHSLTYPESPDAMDWSLYYPAFVPGPSEPRAAGLATDDPAATATTTFPQVDRRVEVADIGCGFGGLLFALAPLMPDTLLLGLEIRVSVTAFVQQKIRAMRAQHAGQTVSTPADPAAGTATPEPLPDDPPSADAAADAAAATASHSYANIACLRANTMKFLPNFFRRAQLRALFLCFPDPHFKARKHKARIVSAGLAAEYAFVLRPRGRVYTITDVEDLHLWMVRHFEAHAGFARVPDGDALRADPCVRTMTEETEEGKKVARNGGTKFVAVFERLDDPPWP